MLSPRWLAPLGLTWVVVVMAAHFVGSWAYYGEKVAVFGRFLMGH
jgi:hypothetical protein